MILYIDETENDDFFIVAGVIFSDKKDMEMAYKQFKKKANEFPIKSASKEKVFVEFKGTLLERRYQRIKKLMMETVKNSANRIVYGMYNKTLNTFPKEEKEMVYIKLLYDIVNSITEPVEIVFDAFKIDNFDRAVVNIIKQHQMCISITPEDSQITHGLQFIDNICGAIRLKQTGENEKYWDIISDLVISV